MQFHLFYATLEPRIRLGKIGSFGSKSVAGPSGSQDRSQWTQVRNISRNTTVWLGTTSQRHWHWRRQRRRRIHPLRRLLHTTQQPSWRASPHGGRRRKSSFGSTFRQRNGREIDAEERTVGPTQARQTKKGWQERFGNSWSRKCHDSASQWRFCQEKSKRSVNARVERCPAANRWAGKLRLTCSK